METAGCNTREEEESASWSVWTRRGILPDCDFSPLLLLSNSFLSPSRNSCMKGRESEKKKDLQGEWEEWREEKPSAYSKTSLCQSSRKERAACLSHFLYTSHEGETMKPVPLSSWGFSPFSLIQLLPNSSLSHLTFSLLFWENSSFLLLADWPVFSPLSPLFNFLFLVNPVSSPRGSECVEIWGMGCLLSFFYPVTDFLCLVRKDAISGKGEWKAIQVFFFASPACVASRSEEEMRGKIATSGCALVDVDPLTSDRF